MGEVWRAHDPRLKRDVAIKILPIGFAGDPDRIARFEQEARAASALSHPNIVSVFDIGQLTWPPLEAGMPHWSPDGKQIAFSGGLAGKPERIYVVPSDGGAVRQVTNGEGGNGDIDPSWSPDGRSLAFGTHDCETAAKECIHVVDLETNHVSAPPGLTGMWSPRWSPDGRFVAGVSAGGSAAVWKLMSYDFQTRKQTHLYDKRSYYPNWSADGAFLFFLSDQWWWRVRMRDRKVERLVKLEGLLANISQWFAVAPNNSLITERNVGTDKIYAIEWEAP